MNNYSEFSCLPKIQQEILLYIKSNPCSFSSVIFNNVPDDAKVSKSYFYDSLKQLMAKQLITRNCEVKPYNYALTLLGKQCVRSNPKSLTDQTFVRSKKRMISEYSIIELQPGNLENFKQDILLPGKWGLVKKHVTPMHWEQIVIRSIHSFSERALIEFRFSYHPKFRIYLPIVFGKNFSEALTKAQEQARSLESCFRDHFQRFGLDIVDGRFNFDSKVVNDVPDDSSREETAQGFFDASELDIDADATG